MNKIQWKFLPGEGLDAAIQEYCRERESLELSRIVWVCEGPATDKTWTNPSYLRIERS